MIFKKGDIVHTEKKLAAIAEGIREFCRAKADRATMERYSKYFKEGYDAYGVPFEALHEEKERLLDLYRDDLGLEGFLDLGDMLFATGKYEEGSLAITLTEAFREEFTLDTFGRFGKWLEKDVRNWAHTDVICGELLSPLIKRKVVSLADFSPWRESHSLWCRRAVPVAMVEFLGNQEDYKPLLDFIDPMMMDEEVMVQKGLGYFLREAWKRQPVVVEEFLLTWKDRAPRVIFQYATEKMSKEAKARFRRAKK